MSNLNCFSSFPKKGTFQYLEPWNPLNSLEDHPIKKVVTCFIQEEEKILVLQRARKDCQHKLWGIPGGKLDNEELPVPGLLRELEEETGLLISPSSLSLLGTTISHTACDGKYGLYMFHTRLHSKLTSIRINLNEHYRYKWVSLEDFETLDLLTAQREAYEWVKPDLINRMIFAVWR